VLEPAAAVAFVRAAGCIYGVEVVCIVDVDVDGVDSDDRTILLVQLFNFPQVLEFLRVDLVVEFVPEG
jgi:hypothetical protein